MTNRLRNSKLFSALLLMVLSLAIFSCRSNDDDVPKPTNENTVTGHDNWAKVEFIVREGHLHGEDFHANSTTNAPILPKVQKFSFELDGNNNVVRKDENGKILQPGEKPLEVQAGFWRYSMEIIYYNTKGERMNTQFVTKEMLPIHQHFFTVKSAADFSGNITNAPDDQYLTDLYTYKYRDTDPIDLMKGQFVPGTTQKSVVIDDAVGLKGYFGFTKGKMKYDMKIRLAHLFTPKYANNGKPFPANNPSSSLLLSGTTDFNQSIPVVVVADFRPDGTPESLETYFKDVADYYLMTVEQVKQYFRADIDESSTFWM